MTTQTPPGTPTATSRLGEVLRDADGVRLTFVRDFDAPPPEVWSALTDPDRLARWFGRWTGDPSTGVVQVTMSAEDGAPTESAVIDACEPPHRLALTFPTPDGAWPLEATLVEHGGGTTLTFVHRMAEPYDAGSIGPGWQYYLDRLAAVVEGGTVPDDFDAYAPALSGSYPVPPAPQA